MRSLSPSAGLIIAVAFAAGCSSDGKANRPGDAGGNDAGQVAVDAPVDAGGSDAGSSDTGSPTDVSPVVDAADAAGDALSALVSFVFTNSTDHTLYLQTSGFSGQEYWSLVEANRRLPVDNACETCECAACQACAVCGRSLARVTEVAPGAQHQWTWDGRIWEVVPDGCRTGLACEQDQRIPAGAALDATVTYSSTFAVDTSFGADDQFIGTPLTATAAFTNAGGATIAITATQ